MLCPRFSIVTVNRRWRRCRHHEIRKILSAFLVFVFCVVTDIYHNEIHEVCPGIVSVYSISQFSEHRSFSKKSMENDRLWLDYTISGQEKKLVNASLAILVTSYPGRTYARFSPLIGFTPNLGEQRYVPLLIFQPDYLLTFDPEAAPSRSVPLFLGFTYPLVCGSLGAHIHLRNDDGRRLVRTHTTESQETF